ncbi:two-component sensor histidine kinase [Actinocatenispora thailandica]|uniref:histidine kinase n=1 Tax=Actinocatenispora thailandica TaxID=227318 RepID=A0A7R7HXD4_9ACTN|nr:sensor histidine kinase [Actinocatenispora thailandica]BCJ35616.1 two-component sensor histidine kinase [Actinocatenispora thailandica]
MAALGSVRRRLAPGALPVDAILAAVVLLVYLLVLALAPESAGTRLTPAVAVWSVLGVLPIAARRRWPGPSVLATLLLMLPGLAWPVAMQTQGLAVIVLTYRAAARLPWRRAAPTFLALWPASMLVGAVHRSSASAVLFGLLVDVLIAMICFVLGQYQRTRRAYLQALEARAVEAERNQRVLAGQAVAEERRRIARELHDVVAHHVSVMGVLATGARRSLTRDPAAATEALGSIEQTGRTTLRELRRLLDVLRNDEEPAAESDALAPAPGLPAIANLVESVRRAGLPVDVQLDGEPYPVDAGIGLAVYRLIQEALTNAVKHAGPASAQVRLGFGPSALSVEVFDTGRGPAADATRRGGHGLVGMRERVALYGGELVTGPGRAAVSGCTRGFPWTLWKGCRGCPEPAGGRR